MGKAEQIQPQIYTNAQPSLPLEGKSPWTIIAVNEGAEKPVNAKLRAPGVSVCGRGPCPSQLPGDVAFPLRKVFM